MNLYYLRRGLALPVPYGSTSVCMVNKQLLQQMNPDSIILRLMHWVISHLFCTWFFLEGFKEDFKHIHTVIKYIYWKWNTHLCPSFQENYNKKKEKLVTSLSVWKIKPKPNAQEKWILLDRVLMKKHLHIVDNIFLKKYIHVMKALIFIGLLLRKSVATDMAPKFNILIAFL